MPLTEKDNLPEWVKRRPNGQRDKLHLEISFDPPAAGDRGQFVARILLPPPAETVIGYGVDVYEACEVAAKLVGFDLIALVDSHLMGSGNGFAYVEVLPLSVSGVCPDCGGRGEIVLLTSHVPCARCRP